jgi:hypothetical protein
MVRALHVRTLELWRRAQTGCAQNCSVLFAEVLDDFRRKEATAYQNMRHLVNDVKYVRQHIAKLFELLRQVSVYHLLGISMASNCSSHSS